MKQVNKDNYYVPKPLMVHSGQFSRCPHGLTYLHSKQSDCLPCARANLKGFITWHKGKLKALIAYLSEVFRNKS